MRTILPLAAAAALLAACEGGKIQGAGNPLDAGRAGFLADQGDPCHPEREALEAPGVEIEGAFDTVLDAGYVVGGVLDSIRETGRVGGTIGAGGVTVAGGYIEALRAESGTVLGMLHNATRDVEAENRRIDRLLAAFDQLAACRHAGAGAIRDDYQAGAFDRATAEAAMGALRRAYGEDIVRFRQIAGQVAANTASYAQVYNEIAADNAADALVVGPYRPGQSSVRVVPAAVRPAATTARVTPPGSLAVDAPAPQARPEMQRLQTELLTNVRKRDAVIERVDTAAGEQGELDLASSPGGTAGVAVPA
jgi:hypothetical protein